MTTCGTCGQENPAGFGFCGRCGVGLTARAADREERKVVTVLYADLVGSTARAEGADPEDVRAVLAPYHALLRRELERFGGTVEKFIGDAVVALFGAPVTHEDDPERAVRAALAVQDAISESNEAEPGLALEVRVGLATGEVLVAFGARAAEGEGLASGDVMNVGARMQTAAPPGGILVDAATFRATKDAIEYERAEPVAARGKSSPLEVWRAIDTRSRLGGEIAAPGTPLVGRERELELLLTTLERVKAGHETQLVTLVGVPGIGKSRLVLEVLEAVRNDPDLVFWRHSRCLPYGEGLTFWPLAEIVRAHAGILVTDNEAAAAAKLRHAVEVAVPDDVNRVEEYLRPLAGLDQNLDVLQERGAEAFAAWRRFFESLAHQRPLVLVVEDVHWADARLLDFVDHLVDWARGVPILVLCTARPELLDSRPGWGGGKLNASTVALSPLSDAETLRLIAGVAEGIEIPLDAQDALLARAEGNPLYAEQYVRMLADRGSPGGDPPASIQGIVAARIDGLPAGDKMLLQDAAVVGQVFWSGALVAIGGGAIETVDERLHLLERKDFVRRIHRPSVAAESEYAFRHVLVRDVAYSQIPRAERATKHELAARWLEALSQDSDRQPELLAHHYGAALELARAIRRETPELVARARRAFRDAGDRAADLTDLAQAARFYGAARDEWPAGDSERGELGLKLARILSVTRGPTLELELLLTEARPALLASGNVEGAAEADAILSSVFRRHGRREESRELIERAVAMLAGRPTSPAAARVLNHAAIQHALAEEDADTIRVGREALAIAEAVGSDEDRAWALMCIGMARIGTGDLAGLEDMEESVVLHERIDSPRLPLSYGNLAAMVGECVGDVRRKAELVEKTREHGERQGSGRDLWMSEQAGTFYWLGRWDEALRLTERFLGSPHEAMIVQGTHCLWARSNIRRARGDADGASSDAELALELARRANDPQDVYPALTVRARVLLDMGRPTEAATTIDELLAHWGDRGGPKKSMFFLAGLASLLGLLDRSKEFLAITDEIQAPSRWLAASRAYARGDFSAAALLYAEIGSRPDEAAAHIRAAEALVAAGELPGDHLERALAFYRSVGATADLREAETLVAARS